jgi:2-hydroxychromene-2-carboxylate isomerase
MSAPTDKQVEFFFDFGSPTSYLAYTQLPKIARESGATIIWRPVLLGGVFKATGNQSPVLVALKGVWMWTDMERWARRYGVPLEKNPHFIINTLTLMRIAVGLQMRQPDQFQRYVDTMFHAMWVEPHDLGNPVVVAEVLGKAGFDPAPLAALAADSEVKTALIDVTDQAVKRGVFGAPTMFVGKEMFFGQDRLEFVREALGL